jgi:Tfp pilus assembly protein PilF
MDRKKTARGRPGHGKDDVNRRSIFFFIILLIPILFFLLPEIVLRLTHFGPDLELFTDVRLNDIVYRTMNPGVSGRYFFRNDFRPGSSPDVFLPEKARNTIRIFCLGGSTTVGFPYWYNAAFPSFLRQRLETIFPDKKVEVINLGITATNSFTVLDMTRSVLDEHPDAIVVYDGHNEYYGALGVASRESLGQMRWVVSGYLALLRFKTFLLMRDIVSFTASFFRTKEDEVDRSTMMERMAGRQLVPIDGQVYRNGISSFRDNVHATAELCADHGVPLVLCTQVSNLRDLPPFESLHSVPDNESRDAQCDSALDAGTVALEQGDFREALRDCGAALSADSNYAMAHFRLACTLDSLGDYSRAEKEYGLARDCDAVRFRASGDLNKIIRGVDYGAVSVDIESTFAAASPHHLIGSQLIFEHLHPDANGQFLISNAIIEAMETHGILAHHDEWIRRDSIPIERLWKERTVTMLDEIIAKRKTEVLRSGWPFRETTMPVSDVSPHDTLGQIAELFVRGIWSWSRAHQAALTFALARNDEAESDHEFRTLLSEYPFDAHLHARYGAFLAAVSRKQAAREELEKSLTIKETANAHLALGDLDLSEGRVDAAVTSYRKSLSLEDSPAGQARVHIALALAYLKGKSPSEARAELQHAARLDPSNTQAQELLRHLSLP